ncbi:MAG: GntR family transcriptional regulator [Thalassotalea sp.]
MEIFIDINNPLPQFSQLIEQIKLAVQQQKIKPGDPLPSIRQLANDLNLNNKTVAKAYSLLERDSVIEAKGYRGSFIHPDAQKNCTINISELVEEKLTEVVLMLRNTGATDSEIRIAFTKAMNSDNERGS